MFGLWEFFPINLTFLFKRFYTEITQVQWAKDILKLFSKVGCFSYIQK